MKQKIVFSILGVILGFVMGIIAKPSHSDELEDYKTMVDDARKASVELNKVFNNFYNRIGYYALGGDDCAIAAAQVMQNLTPNMMKINKSLRLDCKTYDKNGKPSMIKDDKTGKTNPLEGLPEEIRVEEE